MAARTGTVYVIRHTPSGLCYVGATLHLAARWKHHINELRRGRHRNKALQRVFNADGLRALEFSIVAEGIPSGRELAIAEKAFTAIEREPFNRTIIHDARVLLKLRSALLIEVDKARYPKETRLDFIRGAIERELAAVVR